MKAKNIIQRSEMQNCMLCATPVCEQVCPHHLEPARILRSLWFSNEDVAAARLPAELPCATCPAPCESTCLRPHSVPIKNLIIRLKKEVSPCLEIPLPANDSRLKTDLCGIPL